MRTAHIASQSYVEKCKREGMAIYSLCGAEIKGIPAEEVDEESIHCEECLRLLEEKVVLLGVPDSPN